MNRTHSPFLKLLFFAAFFTASIVHSHAQLLQVTGSNTPPFTPQNLITNIFLGDGVEVTNITFNGQPKAVGYFTGGTQSIGIDRGIVMTSGAVESGGMFSVGCNETGIDFASNDNALFTNDPDLAALTTPGFPLRDLAVYTISFIPTDSMLSFRYCFGSEEYPEYGCSPFNDVFGFFIQGPGYPTPTNIAIIPNTSLPVTINNLHPTNPFNPTCNPLNAQYYNAHDTSTTQPSYDGFTDVFTAEATVTPCQVYTIKLAIADVSDGVFDSGVFLEAKSFGTGALRVEVATISLDGAVVEGCAQGTLKFSLPEPLTKDFNIDYNIWGTATNGVDYQTIPSNLSIPAGQTQIIIPVVGIEDGIVETIETIAVDVQRDPCNRDTFYLSVKDNSLVKPNLRPDTTICTGSQPLSLDGTLAVQLPTPPSFTNQQDFSIAPVNTTIISPIVVSGVQPVLLDSGVIKSVCMNITHAWDDDLDIFLIAPGGQFLELTTDNGANGDNYANTCFTPLAATKIVPPGLPFAPASSTPFNGEWSPEGPWSDLWDGDFPTNGTWKLQLRDDANGFAGTLRDWTITFEPTYKVNYKWAPVAGLSCPSCPVTDANPAQTTTYTLVATDSYGCSVVDSVQVEVKNAIAAPIVNCAGSNSSSITFAWPDVSGATGYQINLNGTGWVPVGTVTNFMADSLMPSSSVTLQVQAIGTAADCDGLIGAMTCANCLSPTATSSVIDATCFGKSDGSFTVTPDNLNPPYTFAITGQSNSSGNFQALPAGDYIVTVTDNSGCFSSIMVKVNSAAQLDVTASIVQNVSCFDGNDGSVTSAVNGGTPPYTYKWSDPIGQTTPTAVNLKAGIYVVTVTDASGCSGTATVTLTAPSAFLITTSSTPVSCHGGSDGTATITVTGATPPYTYLWSTNGAMTPVSTGLNANFHFVSVTDSKGCGAATFVQVTEPPQLIGTITATTDVSCFGGNNGTATVSASSGTPPYTYLWSNMQATAKAQNLAANTYTVTVTDGKGCTVTAQATINQPTQITATTSTVQTACFGGSDGTATVTPNGGTSPYTYKWSDPLGQTTVTATGLSAASYTVTITDAKGCTITQTAQVTSPTQMAVALSSTNTSCGGGSDGTATVATSNGTAPYTYKWSDPLGQTTATAGNLKAGSYTVTATDAKGCTITGNAIVNQPEGVNVTAVVTNVSCFGGSNGQITTASTGGTPPFTYVWSSSEISQNISGKKAGNYILTATDSKGCTFVLSNTITEPTDITLTGTSQTVHCFGGNDGSIVLTSAGGTPGYTYKWTGPNGFNDSQSSISTLFAGTYTATVTDAAGCTKTYSTQINQPALPLTAALPQVSDTICFQGSDGTATVVPSGGTPPYTFLWDPNGQTTATATGLVAAPYSVIVTDANGCTELSTTFIVQKEELFALAEAAAPACSGNANGTATVTAVFYGANSANINSFSYLWSTTPPQTGPQATGLAASQTYSVTVTDALGCSDVQSVTIANQPPVLAQISSSGNVKCFGDATGFATVAGSGGTPPYSYAWNGGTQTDSLTQNLPAGIYRATVTDANGCPATTTVTITQPAALDIALSTTDVKCFGESNGTAKATPSGGTPPYQIVWWNGASTQTVENLPAGTIGLSLTDANGCQFIDSVEIKQPVSGVTAVTEKRDVACFGGRDGEISITANGGTPPYRYALDDKPFNGSPVQIGLSAGTYIPKVIDKSGCIFELAPIVIDQRDQVLVDLGPDVTITLGENTQLFAQVANAAGAIFYSWSPEDSVWLSCLNCPDPFVDSLYYENYFHLQVVDSLGCRAEDQILVKVEKPRRVFVPTAFTPNGDLNNDRLLVHGQQSAHILDFRVYDRWGELVFEGLDFALNDPDAGWDGDFRGKPMDPGVYVWVLQVQYMDGYKEVLKGNTTLIR
ncbi:MAG: choice-of-anchor L domain-containing protein [Saprospiraceae bacterium]|nr:choice-of-anchor L domain-containing protein [Saprospiraceae bacterium]